MVAAQEMVKSEQPTSVLALYSSEQIDILRNHVASPDFTDNELAFCLSVARARDLDPFARQVYFSKRRTWIGKGKVGADNEGYTWKVAAEPTIDGFRVMADRTKEMGGYDDPVWCGPDGKWLDVWLSKDAPAAAKVRVYRKGREKSYSAIARFDEYAQRTSGGDLNSMWKKMPANQLAKCAEALALRKAFPEQFGGLYSHEEMGQADNTASKFDTLPREEKKPEIVGVPPANVRQLEQPKAKPAAAPKWTVSQPIPDVIMRGMPPPVRELAGKALNAMSEDDLELVVEQGSKAYTAWKAVPGTVPKLLDLLQAIVIEAQTLLRQHQKGAPPPDEAPKDADMQPLPLDHDPVTGEVLS